MSESKSKSGQTIVQATALMMIGSIVGKGSSFLREILVGTRFGGMGVFSDAFYLGDQISGLIFNMLLGGAISAAVTPTLAKGIENNQEKAVWKSISVFFTMMGLIMFAITIAGQFVTAPLFSFFLKDQYSQHPETIIIAARSAQVLYPQIFFMMLAGLCIGVMNAYKKFTASAFGPAIYSVCVAIFIYFLAEPSEKGVVSASVGMTIACFIYFLFQLIVGRNEMRHFQLSLDFGNPGFRHLLRLAIPSMISGSFASLNQLILSSLAGQFGEGVTTGLSQAKTLWQLPYGILVVPVGTVMIPTLAGFIASKDHKFARGLLAKSLRRALFLMIPCAIIFFLLNEEIVRAAYKWRDTYTDEAVLRTSSILIGYCIAMIAHTFIFILNQAFFATGKTGIPLIGGGMSLILTFIFGRLFSSLGMGETGLAWAYSCASVINALFLNIYYRSNRKLAPQSLIPFLVRAGICGLSLFVVIQLLLFIPFEPDSKIVQLIWLGFMCIAGFGAYLAMALSLRMREVRALMEKIPSRFLPGRVR